MMTSTRSPTTWRRISDLYRRRLHRRRMPSLLLRPAIRPQPNRLLPDLACRSCLADLPLPPFSCCGSVLRLREQHEDWRTTRMLPDPQEGKSNVEDWISSVRMRIGRVSDGEHAGT